MDIYFRTHLGPALRRLRFSRVLKQKELSDKSGLTPSRISRIENAHVSPSAKELDGLLEAMNYDVSDLIAAMESARQIRGMAPRLRNLAGATAETLSPDLGENLRRMVRKVMDRMEAAADEEIRNIGDRR